VSDYVRNYLAEEEHVPLERLQTIHYGVGPEFTPMSAGDARCAVENKFGLHDAYILSVGRIEPRKNPLTLLKAYHRFRGLTSNPPRLVFAGMKTWSAREFDRVIEALGLKPHIVELGHVAHSDLPALYSAAEFSVFPSLWEG